MMEAFIKGLDLHQLDWWSLYANEQEMREYLRTTGNGWRTPIEARERVRNSVASRLFMPVRAAIDADIVAPMDKSWQAAV